MLYERSELLIKEGMEDAFAAEMADKGLPLLKALDGANAVYFGQGVENPDKFMLLIEWETLDAHTAFKTAPVYPEFLSLVASYAKGGVMEHFNMS